MPFPESERVRYAKNPLAEVICQLRFPTILRIDIEVPAAFQESIRAHFPEYRRSGPQLPAGIRVPPQLLDLLGTAATVGHEFYAADSRTKVSLTRDFLALSVTDYTDWRSFRATLDLPLKALVDCYGPAYFGRIGLRYRDEIDRASLGLEDVPWCELLRPEVAGELAHTELAPRIDRTVRELHARFPNHGGNVRLLHGLVADKEPARYSIDADFYLESQTPIGDVAHVLDRFNQAAGNLFRWCITPRLADALGRRAD